MENKYCSKHHQEYVYDCGLCTLAKTGHGYCQRHGFYGGPFCAMCDQEADWLRDWEIERRNQIKNNGEEEDYVN